MARSSFRKSTLRAPMPASPSALVPKFLLPKLYSYRRSAASRSRTNRSSRSGNPSTKCSWIRCVAPHRARFITPPNAGPPESQQASSTLRHTKEPTRTFAPTWPNTTPALSDEPWHAMTLEPTFRLLTHRAPSRRQNDVLQRPPPEEIHALARVAPTVKYYRKPPHHGPHVIPYLSFVAFNYN